MGYPSSIYGAPPANPVWRKYIFPKTVRKVKKMSLARTPLKHPIPGLLLALVPIVVKLLSLEKSPLSAANPGVAKPEASTGRRPHDPFTDHDFTVVIDGIEVGAFQKFDGLSWDCDVIEYKDSLDPHPHKRPGMHRFGNIKLTKGMITNTMLFDWCSDVKAGKLERKNGAITIMDRTNDKANPVLTYEFFAAWPTKWSSFRADGKGSSTLVEEIELAVDSFNIKKG